ncbi:MAG: hypothetical protein KJS90_04705 [Acidobacteria bacterium]|nr:hypothetical protein [Acidobacteriota bacterium]
MQVPTISVPQLQVPTISVPQLQVPTLTVPPLVAPELPTLTAAQPMAVTANSVQATPRRGRQDSTRGTSTNVTPQAVGLVSPETLLGMLRVQQENAAVELVAPQEATTTDRLPIGTFAAFGGGVALVSFALSLLRRREETRSPADAG